MFPVGLPGAAKLGFLYVRDGLRISQRAAIVRILLTQSVLPPGRTKKGLLS
jgi:hypothetical protein